MDIKFNELLLSTEIKGMGKLIDHLVQMGFYTAPASSQNHLCREKGLLEHSLNVYAIASVMPMAGLVDKNDLIVSCLLHDIGKMGAFGEIMYQDNILKSGKISDAKPYVVNKNIVIEHQDLSLMIASKFIDLTRETAIAIKFHNGLYTPDGRTINGKETRLMMILHFADMWASRVVEV